MIEKELYKYRSYASCIASAYNLMTGEFKTIFLQTWLPALAVALIGAIGGTVGVGLGSVETPSELILRIVVPVLVYAVAMLAAGAWLLGNLSSLQTDEPKRKSILRSAHLQVVTLLVIFLFGLVTGAIWQLYETHVATPSVVVASLLTLAAAFVMFVGLLPLSYSGVKYLISPSEPWQSVFGKNYLEGWRHWGFLFAVNFIAIIILALVLLFVQSPSLLVEVAQSVDQYGVSLGDSSGLPAYFKALQCFVLFVTQFVGVYAGIWFYWVLVYTCGTIEEKKAARKQAESNIIMQ